MSIAAIVVNYNSGQWLQRCVNSLLQDSHIATINVVDNASSDDSVSLLTDQLDSASNRRVRIELNQENLGFGRANNQVIDQLLSHKETEIKHVLLINPDCEMTQDVLPVMLGYFDKIPDLGMAGCLIKNSDGSIQATCRRRFPTPWTALLRMTQLHRLGVSWVPNFDLGNEPLPDSMVDVEAISGAFMLTRLSAIKAVGSFDEEYFMHCEDLDWCKRFHQAGWRVGFVPEVSVMHEKGVSSRARPVGVLWNLHMGMLRFFDKFYSDQYPWVVRLLVKVGIYINFCLRAVLTWILGKRGA